MPRLRTIIRTPAILLICAAILVGTVLVALLPLPESQRVFSADRVVRIDGRWRSSAPPPSIVVLPVNDSPSFLRGPTYRITAPPAPEGAPYQLTFRLPAELVGRSPALERFVPDLAAWQVQSAVSSADGWSLSLLASQWSADVWGVGLPVSRALTPRAGDVLSGLMAAPPPGAVGYEAYDADVDANGDALLRSDPLDSGGCGGVFQRGTARTKTTRDFPQDVGAYRVIVRWQIGAGCPPGETLSSAHRPA